jgi:hypothetical protein
MNQEKILSIVILILIIFSLIFLWIAQIILFFGILLIIIGLIIMLIKPIASLIGFYFFGLGFMFICIFIVNYTQNLYGLLFSIILVIGFIIISLIIHIKKSKIYIRKE